MSVFVSSDLPSQPNFINADRIRGCLSPEDLGKVERTVSMVIAEISPEAADWTLLHEKPNYIAKTKSASSLVTSKVEAIIPFSLLDVFKAVVIANPAVDPDKATDDVILRFEEHTIVQYVVCKAPWPVSYRDFILLSHWRVLEDGSVLIVSSCHSDYDHLKPAVDGYIRADIQYFGMVLKATDTGTSITRVITMDMKGTLLQFIMSLASSIQCESVQRIHTYLEESQKNGMMLKPVDYIPSYDDLVTTYRELHQMTS